MGGATSGVGPSPNSNNLAQLEGLLQMIHSRLTTPIAMPGMGAAPLQAQTGALLQLLQQAINTDLLSKATLPGNVIAQPFRNVTSMLNNRGER